MYPDHDGGQAIRLKRHEIGVAFYYPDHTADTAVFDVRQLWQDIVNPKPTQLALSLEFQE